MKPAPSMISKGASPLLVININDSYVLGIYQGKISKFDLLLKYRQQDKSTSTGWSRIRTPKHIHWAVDILIKMQYEKEEMEKFLSFLLEMWNNNITPIETEKQRSVILDIDSLRKEINDEASKYPKSAGRGEYSIKFLYLIAKLLMIQEKTNLSNAYMFKDLLEALKNNKDIYKIVSIATHNRR